MQDIQTLFTNLLSENRNIRDEAELRLISMEEEKRVTAKELAGYIDHYKDKLAVIVYLVEAIFRIAYANDSEDGFREVEQLVKDSDDILLLLEFLSCCNRIKHPYFIDCVAILAGIKVDVKQRISKTVKKLIGSNHSNKNNTPTDRQELSSELLMPALKYFQDCSNEYIADRIKVFLTDEDPLIRYHSLLVFYKNGYPLDKKLIKEMSLNDANEENKKLAKLYLEQLEGEVSSQ